MSFVSILRGLSPAATRTAVVTLAIAACLATDGAAARGAPHVRRVSAPRIAFENHGGRSVERAPRAPRPPQERPVEAAPMPVEPALPAPAPERARPGRLTPDERRALRQQINDAGRDIYRPGRP